MAHHFASRPPAQPQREPAPPIGVARDVAIFRFHAGARGALTIVAVLLCLLVIPIPFAIWIIVRASAGRIEITDTELIARALFTKRWSLGRLRRLGVLTVPVYARGIGGALARRKVGGNQAIHLCSIDDRGRKSTVLVSMFERYPEIVNRVSAMTGLAVEPLEMGAFGPKWSQRDGR